VEKDWDKMQDLNKFHKKHLPSKGWWENGDHLLACFLSLFYFADYFFFQSSYLLNKGNFGF